MKLLCFGLLFLITIHAAYGACPNGCSCDRDSSNRKRVRCDSLVGLTVAGSFSPQVIDKDTEVLYISAPPGKSNQIDALRPTMFKDMKLQELHILNCQLPAIGDRTFFHLSGTLKVLNLAYNNFVDINENNFRNLSGLTHLHLDHNRIIHLHSATFNYQRSLKVLTLSNNRIYDLGTRFLLQEQPTLEVVDLSGNPLGGANFEGLKEYIPDLIFQDVPNLRRVSFANTSIDRLPFAAVARHCKNLEDLDVSQNQFTVIADKQFNTIKSLRKLNLAGNQLTAINAGALKGMKLDYLDLSATHLPHLQASIFEGAEVRGLSLASNDLQNLDTTVFIPIAQELTSLDVGGNPLSLKDRMFQFLPKLKGLSLANMRLKKLPEKFFDYDHQITSFNISGNLFQQLEDAVLLSLTKLEVVDVSSNEIKRLPVQLAQATITDFYASNNLIQKVPDHYTDVFRDASSKIKNFRVHGNPLACNWSVGGLADWTSTTQGRSVVCGRDAGQRCPVCHGPPELKGKLIDEIRVTVASS